MRDVHAPGPELARQALREGAHGEFARREGGAVRATFEGGGGAGDNQGWGVRRCGVGGGGGGGEEEGNGVLSEVEESASVGGCQPGDRHCYIPSSDHQ